MTSSLPSLLDVGLFTERREHESFDLYRAQSEPPHHIGPEPDEGFYVLNVSFCLRTGFDNPNSLPRPS